MSKKKATDGKGKGVVDRNARAQQREVLGEHTYLLGPQDDGSIVVHIQNDFDLMVTRRACEKQMKNKQAAVGTVSALADGDDPFLDAVERSLQRVLQALNRSRAPENQIKGTPIGEEIARNAIDDDSAAAASDSSTHHSGTRVWADAIPAPRPQQDDVIQYPDGACLDIVDALGFRAAGLTGSESADELREIAEHSPGQQLEGAFEVIVKGRDENAFVQFYRNAGDDRNRNIWRVVGGDYSDTSIWAQHDATATPLASGSSNNIANTVSETISKATGQKRVDVKRSKTLKGTKKKK